jgi:hypothetical protein
MTRPQRRGITQPSARTTNTPATGSGAGAGRFSHWTHPGGGVSSSGMSTTAAQSPAVGADAGGAGIVAVTTAVAATANPAFCCGPVAMAVGRGGPPVATVPPAARGTLDERRLIGTDVTDLSALAGVRAGTDDVTLRMKKHKTEHQPLETRGTRGKCYLPQIGETPLPLPRGFGRCRCTA